MSEDAEFLDRIPGEFATFYGIVPQARIRQLLEIADDTYRAVLSDRKGCVNSGLLVQQVLGHLERAHPERFRYVDQTDVDRIEVGGGARGGAVVHAGGHPVTAAHVVLCTNGFVDHVVHDANGAPITLHPDQQVTGTLGYMAAFVEEEPRSPAAMSYIRNTAIGGETPYVYVTRRTYDRADGPVTLTCMGGPEHAIDGPWIRDQDFPGDVLTDMDAHIRPFAQPTRPAGRPYDFQWRGLMGYTGSMVRVVGPHPRHPRLIYNLGCNGVGFLPSICGGLRVARILAGEQLARSIFDPR